MERNVLKPARSPEVSLEFYIAPSWKALTLRGLASALLALALRLRRWVTAPRSHRASLAPGHHAV